MIYWMASRLPILCRFSITPRCPIPAAYQVEGVPTSVAIATDRYSEVITGIILQHTYTNTFTISEADSTLNMSIFMMTNLPSIDSELNRLRD